VWVPVVPRGRVPHAARKNPQRILKILKESQRISKNLRRYPPNGPINPRKSSGISKESSRISRNPQESPGILKNLQESQIISVKHCYESSNIVKTHSREILKESPRIPKNLQESRITSIESPPKFSKMLKNPQESLKILKNP